MVLLGEDTCHSDLSGTIIKCAVLAELLISEDVANTVLNLLIRAELDLLRPSQDHLTIVADRILWFKGDGIDGLNTVQRGGLLDGEVSYRGNFVGLDPQVIVVLQLLDVVAVVGLEKDIREQCRPAVVGRVLHAVHSQCKLASLVLDLVKGNRKAATVDALTAHLSESESRVSGIT